MGKPQLHRSDMKLFNKTLTIKPINSFKRTHICPNYQYQKIPKVMSEDVKLFYIYSLVISSPTKVDYRNLHYHSTEY